MNKTQDETFDLLEKIAMNNYQWSNERIMPKKAVGIYEGDAIIVLTT